MKALMPDAATLEHLKQQAAARPDRCRLRQDAARPAPDLKVTHAELGRAIQRTARVTGALFEALEDDMGGNVLEHGMRLHLAMAMDLAHGATLSKLESMYQHAREVAARNIEAGVAIEAELRIRDTRADLERQMSAELAREKALVSQGLEMTEAALLEARNEAVKLRSTLEALGSERDRFKVQLESERARSRTLERERNEDRRRLETDLASYRATVGTLNAQLETITTPRSTVIPTNEYAVSTHIEAMALCALLTTHGLKANWGKEGKVFMVRSSGNITPHLEEFQARGVAEILRSRVSGVLGRVA